MTTPVEPILTPAQVEAIAAMLREDPKRTLLSACIMVGCADRYVALKQSCSRIKRGVDVSAERTELLGPILLAIAEQCEALLLKAEALAADGKPASLYTWWLEKKDRHEYATMTKHEVTGEDGGPVQVEDMSKLSHEELLKTYLAVNPAQQGGGG